MLILSRKSKESVVIGAADDMQELVRVTVLEVRGGTVKLGFAANDDVAVYREEVWERSLRRKSGSESDSRCRTAKVSRAIHRLNTKEAINSCSRGTEGTACHIRSVS